MESFNPDDYLYWIVLVNTSGNSKTLRYPIDKDTALKVIKDSFTRSPRPQTA